MINICKPVWRSTIAPGLQPLTSTRFRRWGNIRTEAGGLARPQQPRPRTWPHCDRLELGMVLESKGIEGAYPLVI